MGKPEWEEMLPNLEILRTSWNTCPKADVRWGLFILDCLEKSLPLELQTACLDTVQGKLESIVVRKTNSRFGSDNYLLVSPYPGLLADTTNQLRRPLVAKPREMQCEISLLQTEAKKRYPDMTPFISFWYVELMSQMLSEAVAGFDADLFQQNVMSGV